MLSKYNDEVVRSVSDSLKQIYSYYHAQVEASAQD